MLSRALLTLLEAMPGAEVRLDAADVSTLVAEYLLTHGRPMHGFSLILTEPFASVLFCDPPLVEGVEGEAPQLLDAHVDAAERHAARLRGESGHG